MGRIIRMMLRRPGARRVPRVLLLTAVIVLVAALTLTAQGVYRGYVQGGDPADINNPTYDGRFTFARIRFEPAGGEGYRRRDAKWDHDVPRAERNFMKILSEVTILEPYMDGGTILTLDDPQLFKYPIAYLCEAGFWVPTDTEVAALRAYLTKGGFLIFDDFIGEQWYNFEEQIRRVLPQARLIELDLSQPVFDSFFQIKSLEMVDPTRGTPSKFYGVFEDNDPTKRLMIVANYNNDIGDYWEFSDVGYFPVQLSNEAYKLGVNYIMYGLTH